MGAQTEVFYTVKLVLGDHVYVWALKNLILTGGLCMKVKINSKVTFGTQPSGLYREVVSGYRWSLRQVLLYSCELLIQWTLTSPGPNTSSVLCIRHRGGKC